MIYSNLTANPQTVRCGGILIKASIRLIYLTYNREQWISGRSPILRMIRIIAVHTTVLLECNLITHPIGKKTARNSGISQEYL